MATKVAGTYALKPIAPFRSDAPGAVTKMPSPREMHHVHIFSDENYDAMVNFYQMIFNGEITNVNNHENRMELTFITYDDHDHRVVVIRQPGWGTKPNPGRPVPYRVCLCQPRRIAVRLQNPARCRPPGAALDRQPRKFHVVLLS